MKITVSIADDHPIVLSGVSRLLAGHPLVELSHAYGHGEALLQGLETVQPDVLLLDIQMPGVSGEALAKIISERCPQVAILVLTNMEQAFHVRSMFRNGARGYLLKSADLYTLVEAIDTVHRGQQYIDPSLKGLMLYEVLDGKKAGNIPSLTRREQEILELIAEGLTSVEIGRQIFLSPSTVENHRTNLFFKLGVKNAVGVVQKGRQMGLIK